MRLIALGMILLMSACAPTVALNPNDPVDMAAALGNRGRDYVGMGETCDAAAAGGHRAAIVQAVQHEQQRLGVLAGLVNRAYRGHASEAFSTHLNQQTSAHGLTADAFCAQVVAQAQSEFAARTTQILALRGQVDGFALVRDLDRPLYPDTPSFEPGVGYTAWP